LAGSNAAVSVCVECGRRWHDPDERLPAYMTVHDQTAFYCPNCAKDEFEQEPE